MDEDVKSLGDYFSIAWRRKFHILVPFVLVLLVTVATVFLLPPVYKSTGTILIESQQIPEELIQSTVTSFADERIQIIQQRIMTSQQLIGIIKKFDLYQEALRKTPRSEILEDMRKRISIDRVSANVRSQRQGSSALIAFTVSFEHPVPGVAQKVANELVTLFLDENIRSRTERAEETSEFLAREGDRLRLEIEEMEGQIAGYKQEYEGSLPEAFRLNLERVLTLKQALLKSEEDLNDLKERRKFAVIELDSLQNNPESVELSREEQLRKQDMLALQNQYISLSARYGPEHPDVKSAKRQIDAFKNEFGIMSDIEDLEKQRITAREELAELSKDYSEEHPDVKKQQRKLEGIEAMIAEYDLNTISVAEKNPSNPQLLQAKARIEAIDNSLERVRRSQIDLQKQIDELEIRISRTPQVERGLEALVRDYENTRRKYQELKAKQLQAELSKSLEEEQKGERFTLLEPPLLPDKPIKPNRPKIFALGLVISMLGGVGVAGVAESLDSGIRGSRALANVTRMTPLVTIPYITTRQDEKRRKRLINIAIILIIIAGIAFIIAVHFFYKPLDLLWFILLRKLNLT